jgi:phytanoyl-CoA hydroxylase
MYIFKQPNIGGEVVCHQDSTFLYTEPDSVVGFWVALEDATVENGCLWVNEGGHKGPLRKLFTKHFHAMKMITLDETPFDKNVIPIEVKKGTLVMLHGRLPHYSLENTSNKSRHAYTLHVIDGNKKYPKENWLQRPKLKLKGFL